MSAFEAFIVVIFALAFPWAFWATWPYSGYFFLAVILIGAIREELRDAARQREKVQHDQRI